MIKYPNLVKNLNIGIPSISDGTNEKMNEVMNYLDSNNIHYEYSPFIFESTNQVSSSVLNRATTFMEMWNDENINYMISAFGGEFCMEILSYVYKHKDDFIQNKKWFQGFSDASFLSYFLTTNYNIATLNYYNAEDYGSVRNIDNLKNTLDTICQLRYGYSFIQENSKEYVDDYSRDIDDTHLKIQKTTPKFCENAVTFSGILIGGWIEAISTICGTKYDNTKKFCDQFDEGVIWYIDNCELSSPMLRRKLWQMSEAGYFDNCNGVLLGREPKDDFEGEYCYSQAIDDTFRKIGIPVIEDVDIGHFFPQWLIVNGSHAELDYNKGNVKLLQRLK